MHEENVLEMACVSAAIPSRQKNWPEEYIIGVMTSVIPHCGLQPGKHSLY